MSNIQSDKSSYRSDVLSVLTNIENIFRLSQDVLCTHARNGLLFSVAMEAQMLALKLDTMANRWRVHIPFKEACKVDFMDWAKKIEAMGQYLHNLDNDADVMDMDAYCPDKHFLLDLYTRLLAEKDANDKSGETSVGQSPYYNETNMQAFVEKQDRLHKSLAEHWVNFLDEFSELAARHVVMNARSYSNPENLTGKSVYDFSPDCFESQIADMSDDCDIRIACCAALMELAHKLYALNESLERSFTSLHFTRLTERVLIEREYGGADIRTKVRTEIAQWKNDTPDDEIESGRNEEMMKAYNNIVEMKFRRKFQDYVRLYTPDIDQKKNAIGKFLFHCRRDITISELNDFMTNLFRIIYFRKDQLRDIENNNVGDASAKTTESHDADVYLSDKLCASPKAKQLFYKLLSDAAPYVCRKLTFKQKKDAAICKYEGWSWWHLKRVFLRYGFIVNGISDKDFFEFLSTKLANRSYTSISQGYYRTDHGQQNDITEKVMEEFRPVAELLSR